MKELADYLSHFFQISVITTDIKYDHNVSNDINNLGYKIVRKKIGNVDKNSFFNRVKSALLASLLLSYELLKNIRKEDKALVVTNPFLIIFFVAVIRTFKKFEYTLLVHDVFPENTIPSGLKKKESWSYKLLKLVFDWSYRKADEIVVLGHDMKELLMKKGVSEAKLNIITNWHDDEVNPMVINREKYFGITSLKDKIVLGFAGNVGRVQGLEKFLECFTRSNNPQLVFVIIGDGAALGGLKNKYSDNENILFLGNKPRSEQSLFLNSFDISLVTLAAGMYGLGVPSKSYNILKSGKPILYIGDAGSEIDIMVRKFDCGWSFNWDDKEKIIHFLNRIQSDELVAFECKNEDLADKYFSPQTIKKQFATLLNKY